MNRIYTALMISVLIFCCVNSFVWARVALNVTGDHVNLRVIANGESEVVTQVSRGDIVYADSMPGSNEWVKVAIPAGRTVWVCSELVKNNIVSVSKLSVRSGPGINYRIVGMLNKGDHVVSHGMLRGWMKIDAPESCRAFISNKYVVPAGITDVGVDKQKETSREQLSVKPVVSAVISEKKKTPVIIKNQSPVTVISEVINQQKEKPIVLVVEKEVSAVKVPEVVVEDRTKPAFPVMEPEDIISLSAVNTNSKSNMLDIKKSATNTIIKVADTNNPVFGDATNKVVVKLGKGKVLDIISTDNEIVVASNVVDSVSSASNLVNAVTQESSEKNKKQEQKSIQNDGIAEPVIVKAVESVNKPADDTIIHEEIADYVAVISNDMPACISSDRIDYSYEQGCGVVLNGKVIHVSFSSKHNPWRYRLVNGKGRSALNCYLVSPEENIKRFDDKVVRVKGRVYWLKGIKHEVVIVDNIKKIPALPVLP